jgi:farnesyl-diphosphate farnesyltransferase
MADAASLLLKTSRTFALAIPLLPEPTRKEVEIAYLLFRIIDTFEDADRWSPARRTQALAEFVAVMDAPPGEGARQMAEACLREPPVDRPEYLELLAHIPLVLEELSRLNPDAARQIRAHAARTAHGMSTFVVRTSEGGTLQLETLRDLRDYCYMVAGIVGELLTELYVLGRPGLAGIAADLRARAAAFGEGLQLVNILKDAGPDARAGRIYLPSAARLDEVFAMASDDLRTAAVYTELLRAAGAQRGLVAFNALISQLAVATLDRLARDGLGAKLTRGEVMSILAQVAQGLDSGQPIAAAL